ncbi:hypothetical protein [Mucilaginibacter myungsuensis]|uniref:Uncharacterized protein n=1 Tax=Mucilaginibacter myungsuensis TaxID=649104 RepID=A0A929KU58_9SPHI|nr:hypothetical protein [Mucilaginibacter myungsuensis]MBE9661631.1 hypothetical protein [Mucilaginibacter myungsuensis]MDN3597775.1 hypothetical protein [Mucilaginibacter myungsuensis]
MSGSNILGPVFCAGSTFLLMGAISLSAYQTIEQIFAVHPHFIKTTTDGQKGGIQ